MSRRKRKQDTENDPPVVEYDLDAVEAEKRTGRPGPWFGFVGTAQGLEAAIVGSAAALLQAAAMRASAQISVVRVGRTRSDLNPTPVLCDKRDADMHHCGLATHCRKT